MILFSDGVLVKQRGTGLTIDQMLSSSNEHIDIKALGLNPYSLTYYVDKRQE